jgi:hypothetical protein
MSSSIFSGGSAVGDADLSFSFDDSLPFILFTKFYKLLCRIRIKALRRKGVIEGQHEAQSDTF